MHSSFSLNDYEIKHEFIKKGIRNAKNNSLFKQICAWELTAVELVAKWCKDEQVIVDHTAEHEIIRGNDSLPI